MSQQIFSWHFWLAHTLTQTHTPLAVTIKNAWKQFRNVQMRSKYGWQFSGCPPSKFVSCTICAAFIAYDKFATHESRVTAHAFAHFNCPRALKCHSTINWRQPGLAKKSYILLKIKYSYNLKVNATAKVSYKRAENKSKGFFWLFNWAKKSKVKKKNQKKES